MATTVHVERRDGRRFGYWTPGILRRGVPNWALRTWASRRAARAAARREYPKATVVG